MKKISSEKIEYKLRFQHQKKIKFVCLGISVKKQKEGK
jgi:hypothetical protein